MRRSSLAFALVLGATQVAGADVSKEDAKRATALFEAGQRLLDAKQVDVACDTFAKSLQLDPQLGTRLNLANCREQQGKPLDAYRLYEQAADEAARDEGKRSREKFARDRLGALNAKLARVAIQVAGPEPTGLTVTVDGRRVTLPERARQIRAPGTLVVEVTAPGHRPFRSEVPLKAGAKVTVDVPALAPIVVAPVEPPPVPAPVSERRRVAKLPFIVAGAGGALVITSIVVALHAKSRYDQLVEDAPPDLNAKLDGPQRQANIATGLALAGGVAVAVGVVLYVRRGPRDVVVAPTASGDGGGGVSITGTF